MKQLIISVWGIFAAVIFTRIGMFVVNLSRHDDLE